MKSASTGWRIVRYYAGTPPYQQAGPPPMLLRLLGPRYRIVVTAGLGRVSTVRLKMSGRW
jgi:hypothetical protein